MYIRVTHGQYPDLATADSEAAKQLWAELLRTVKALPGNQSFTGGVDPAGRAIAVSIWDTEEQAREQPLVQGVSDIAAKLGALGLRIDPSEFFEVRPLT